MNKEREQRVKDILGEHANTFWGKRIIAAAKRGEFTDKDCDKAKDWTVCACGNLDERIPHYAGGEPIDGQLGRLGEQFNDAVAWNYIDNAAGILVSIEQRAAEILNPVKA